MPHVISIRAASGAASVISGLNPSKFDSADPLRLFIIQAGM